MKYLSLIVSLVVISGCVSNIKAVKSCAPNKHVTVFAEKKIKVDKSIDVSNEKRLVVRSYQKPIINRSLHNKIFLEGIQGYSVQGYHTNECTAEESKANVASAKASVGYQVERKNGNIYVSTTGEWRFIHHQTTFESIKITLPEGMAYQYIHVPLKILDNR